MKDKIKTYIKTNKKLLIALSIITAILLFTTICSDKTVYAEEYINFTTYDDLNYFNVIQVNCMYCENMLESINELKEIKNYYNHISLLIDGVQAGLLIALIIAVIWRGR